MSRKPFDPSAPVNPDRLYRLGEIAQLMGLSLRTVYGIVGRGDLPTVQHGRSRRVRGQDYLDYLDKEAA